jgi:PAS domain S-box-containing protein
MALIDSQTNLFLEVNDKILQDTGYSKDEFLNLSFWDVIPVEYQNQEAQQIRELDQKIRFSSNEKEYLRKDGSRYPIDISGFKFVYHNGKEVTWIFIEDISKRKQLAALVIEQALDKVQIAHLDRQRSLGLMSASLGHELKQPLTAILTNAQVAKRGIQKELLSMPLVEAFLDKIIYNVQRTSHVIERIRGFIDPPVLEKTVVDIGQLVVNTAALLEQDFMLHNIAIQFSIEDDRMKVLADEVLLTQVFVNIYRNAMEALVLQKIKIIYVSVTEKDSRIIIVVRDTGLGIAKEVLKFISEPFYTTKVGGLGVGLSISRSIIEQYEGQLIIANAKEGGARLEIQLPQFLNDTCSHCTGCDES